MSGSDSDSNSGSELLYGAAINDYPSEGEQEIEDTQAKKQWRFSSDSESEYLAAYAQEPLADEACLKQYKKEKEQEEQQQNECDGRLKGLVLIDSW